MCEKQRACARHGQISVSKSQRRVLCKKVDPDFHYDKISPNEVIKVDEDVRTLSMRSE